MTFTTTVARLYRPACFGCGRPIYPGDVVVRVSYWPDRSATGRYLNRVVHLACYHLEDWTERDGTPLTPREQQSLARRVDALRGAHS